nr:hypothetical protein [Tanacetum cinerariifolium]
MAQHVIPAAQLVPQYKQIRRCNNYAVLQSIPCSPECKIVGLTLLDHYLSHALTTIADVPALYLQQFWRTVSKRDFISNVFQKKEAIQYPRFIKLIVADLMKNFPNSAKRLEEDYHSIKDDVHSETDAFKEYETVFMKVVVPMNQPQLVVSTQGMHRVTPSAHRKSLKITIKKKQLVEKDDDDSKDRIEPGSHKDNPDVVDDDDDDKEREKEDDEMSSLEVRNEETQTTIPSPLSFPRKILSSKKKTFQELTDTFSNPTISISKHSTVKKRISSKYSHLPGALRRMCRRQDVARGHDGKGTRKPNLGGRRAGMLHACQETQNLRLKAITDKSGLIPIWFEVDDRETLMPLGDHVAHWANYNGEIIRELPLHYPSWRQMPPERMMRVVAKIRFDLRPHMESDRWPQIYAGIQQHLQKIYNSKNAALKERYWVPEEDETYDLERIRRERPSHIFEVDWDAQLAFLNDPKNLDEMLMLQSLGSNTPTGVPYTEDEIMTIVHGASSEGTNPAQKEREAAHEQVNMIMRLFRSDDKFSQMISQLESQPEYDGGSASDGCGDDEPGDDEDDDEDEEDEDDVSRVTCRPGKPSTVALNCLTETMWVRRCLPGRFVPGDSGKCCSVAHILDEFDIEDPSQDKPAAHEQVNMIMRLFRSDDKFSQMISQLESQPEYDGGSASDGCGDDEPGDDEDDGEDEEDEDDG